MAEKSVDKGEMLKTLPIVINRVTVSRSRGGVAVQFIYYWLVDGDLMILQIFFHK